jgi:hypothetical protein
MLDRAPQRQTWAPCWVRRPSSKNPLGLCEPDRSSKRVDLQPEWPLSSRRIRQARRALLKKIPLLHVPAVLWTRLSACERCFDIMPIHYCSNHLEICRGAPRAMGGCEVKGVRAQQRQDPTPSTLCAGPRPRAGTRRSPRRHPRGAPRSRSMAPSARGRSKRRAFRRCALRRPAPTDPPPPHSCSSPRISKKELCAPRTNLHHRALFDVLEAEMGTPFVRPGAGE